MYKPQPGGELDAKNSSTTPLGAGGVFTGTATEIIDAAVIFIDVFSDVASATNGLCVYQSSNGIDWDHAEPYTVKAGKARSIPISPRSQWYKIIYTNGVIAQNTFRLNPIIKEMDSNIDESLSSKAGVSIHARRSLGGATTLSVLANAGETFVTVNSVVDFAIGDNVILYNTTIAERGHFHITDIAGSVVTLNRPIDNDFEVGDHLDEVEINMNKVGSLASPISYKIQPIGIERIRLARLLITMLDPSPMDDGKFGGITALPNGIAIRVKSNGLLRTLTHWQSNTDLKNEMYDVLYSDKAPAGKFGLSGRWTFTKGKFDIDLDGSSGDYFEVLIQDDLSGLDNFEIKAQGRLLGS